MPEAQRDAKSAWQWLVKSGGIEPDGRDLPLITILKERLDPEALSLAGALSSVSVTVFLNTFFGVISPFVSMMRDLLEYFEAAGATEGPVNWVLVLGDDREKLEVDLDAFKRWIKAAEKSKSGLRMVPDLGKHELFEMRKCFYPTRDTDPNLAPGEVDYRQPEPRTKSAELTKWLDAYERGDYLDLPKAVGTALADKGPVRDVAALLIEIYSAIRAIASQREELRRKGYASTAAEDFWSARGLWYFESDYWLRGRVLDLAAYAQATKQQQMQVRTELTDFFKGRPYRRMKFNVDMSELEQILSLPAWKKRYELYSAWIFTLLLKALEGHATELQHDKGRISFSFKETLMARVPTANPPVTIYSERRVALANPTGHGRSQGAQPDYSFWTDDERCPLAIECKHYKRSSTRNFADALNDYSAALGSARVILANYGPISPAVKEAIKKDRRPRCIAIGYVNPSQASAVERFCEEVREVIGVPRALPNLSGIRAAVGSANPKLLVVDVSESMGELIKSSLGRAFLADLMRQTGVNEIAAVDNALIAHGRRNQMDSVLSKQGSGETDLGPAARELIKNYDAILILTDAGGAATLDASAHRLADFSTAGCGSLQLFLVSK